MSATISDQILDGIRKIAVLQLWDIGAIKINTSDPFPLTSGNYSPIYINCRQLISSVAFMDLFALAARLIFERESVEFDVFAGGETAGIPFAAFLARSFGRPMIYVRKAVKEHGIATRIEGALKLQDRVILIEDLITDAGSKLSFIKAISDAHARVSDVLVVFDRLQGGGEALLKEGIRLHSLTTIDAALQVAKQVGGVSETDLAQVRAYFTSPQVWHEQRGLEFKR
jgi:orotate phosphoribosyltransferase